MARLSRASLGPVALLLLACQPGVDRIILPSEYQERCDPVQRICPDSLACLFVRGEDVCTTTCAKDTDCLPGGRCDGDEGVCFALTGAVADPCADDEDCHPGLECLSLPGAGFCTAACGPGAPCPGDDGAVCIRMNPPEMGTWCLRRCDALGEEDACATGLSCTILANGGYGVCFP